MGWKERAESRDRKLRKRRDADMLVSNRSLKTIILPMIGKRAKPVPKKGAKRDR